MSANQTEAAGAAWRERWKGHLVFSLPTLNQSLSWLTNRITNY